jgi:periplasmic divalent cation tolerance protein
MSQYLVCFFEMPKSMLGRGLMFADHQTSAVQCDSTRIEKETAMSVVLVYVTAGGREEALSIARTVVSERLAACANILGEITSVFRWDGEIQEDGEVSLLLKTRADRADALTARIRELHSYDCPCVVCLPVTAGNDAFLNWIHEETDTLNP